MSSSTHQIKVKANDQTAGAFASIQNRAKAAGVNIRKMLGGAIAAAGAYLGVRSFVAGVDELGRLSDTAMKASTSVDELTSAATALKVLGINSSIDSLAQAFAKMAQTTGRTGMAGFYQTIGEIGKISDIAKRSEATMKVFGRAGLEFMPLVNAAKDSTSALETLIAALPKVPQAAAEAGDALSDAKTIGVEGFKSLWLQAISSIAESIDTNFKGGVREAAMDGVSYFSYFAKMSYSRIKWLFNAAGIIAGAMSSNWQNIIADMEKLTESFIKYQSNKFYNIGVKLLDQTGLSEWFMEHKINVYKGNSKSALRGAMKSLWYNINGAELENEFDKLIESEDNLRRMLTTQFTKNAEAAEAYNKAAISTGDRLFEDIKDKIGGNKTQTIRNNLIIGGTNDATKLSILGPQTQQELKKQTSLLTQIRDATKTTSVNTAKDELIVNYGELN